MSKIKAFVVPGQILPPGFQKNSSNLVLKTMFGCVALAIKENMPIESYMVKGEIGSGKFKSPEEFYNYVQSAVKPKEFVRQSNISPDATWDNVTWREFCDDYHSLTQQKNSWREQNLSFSAVKEKLRAADL